MSKINLFFVLIISLFSLSISLINKEANCKSGQFADGDKCSFCPEGCETCYSLDICLSCIPGYRYTNNQCEKCQIDHCNKCINNKATCNGCFNGYYLSQDNTCLPCPEYCFDCESENCKSCKPGSYLNEGKCNKCNIKNCAECLDENVCKRCNTGYGINLNGNCQKCSDILNNCETCDFNSNSCLSCSSGFYLNQNKCSPCKDTNCRKCRGNEGEDCYECYKGYGGDTCEIKCEDNCDECASFGCTTCSPYYFFNLEGGCNKCNGDCITCHAGICYEADLKCVEYEYYDPDYKMCLIHGNSSYFKFSLILVLFILICIS